jgi:putative ABC transport system permease protein
MLQDVRYSLRALARQPSFACTAVLVLGLAVGVNTAVFSLINSLLLRPLPVHAPHELGFVYYSGEGGISYSNYLQLLEKTDAFSGLAARAGDLARLHIVSSGASSGVDELVTLYGEMVSQNYFDVLGVRPRMGRAFDAGDGSLAATPLAVISETLWRTHFGADPDILGRALRIESPAYQGRYMGTKDYTIVGVMPAEFRGTGSPWQPAVYWVLLPQRALDRASHDPRRIDPIGRAPALPIGRLKPGVSFFQARAAVDVAGRDIIQHQPYRVEGNPTYVLEDAPRLRLPFQGAFRFSVPRLVAALIAVATLLMVIAATNLAGMLLARGVARRAEIGIRLSLGAGKARLMRQLLVESLLLAVGGTLAGLALARVLVIVALREIPRLPGMYAAALSADVPLDWRVLLFAAATCFGTALVVGLMPAIAAVRVDLLSSLAGGGAGVPRQSRSRMRRLVLVPQVALALMLLLVSGVLVRSLLRVELASAGYDPVHVVLLNIQLPFHGTLQTNEDYAAERDRLRAVIARMLARAAAVPEVQSAAITQETIQDVALAESGTTIIARSDYGKANAYKGATTGYISADYFKTMGIPLLRGRPFDVRDAVPVAATTIVSERLAHELWPGRDPIGEAIAFHSPQSRMPPRWMEVVGVAKSVTLPLEVFPRPVFYVPIESSPHGSTLAVRGTGHPAQLIDRVKKAVAGSGDGVIVARARTLTEAVAAVRYPRRFSAALLGVSGLAGMILMSVGVFGLMSYAVAQRVAEIGVRMVLGAQRRDVIRLILFDGAGVVVAGIVIGFALAFSGIRYASHAIVPLPDADPLTFVVVPAVLIAVVLLACYLPARRAARVDPLVVLRNS